jgi:hypothetical protein
MIGPTDLTMWRNIFCELPGVLGVSDGGGCSGSLGGASWAQATGIAGGPNQAKEMAKKTERTQILVKRRRQRSRWFSIANFLERIGG